MKKIIVCLIFLISFVNAIQCYNGKTYVDIPESKLSDIGYTKYNITHSSFDCKIAYKRYLKVKEIEPVNVSYVTKSENEKLEEPSKMGSFLPICLLVIIICIIWIIKIAVKKEPQDEWYLAAKKEPVKQNETDKSWNDLSEYYENLERIKLESQKTEPVKSWNDLSREYSENLRKIEQERQNILGKNYPVKRENNIKSEEQVKSENTAKSEEQVKSENTAKSEEQIKSENTTKSESVKPWNDLSREYNENLRKIEQERVKNGFYEIPKTKPAYTIIKNKPFNNSSNKTKTAYDLLLERPEWKAYRLKVLAIKGEKCEWCQSDENLQVHHKYYLKYPDGKHILPWEYNINALLVLCKDCHTKAHKKYKIKSYYISY